MVFLNKLLTQNTQNNGQNPMPSKLYLLYGITGYGRVRVTATLALDVTVTSVQRPPTASLPAPTHGPRG